MKKIILFFLLFTFLGLIYSFSYDKVEKYSSYEDPIVGYVTINGVEYTLYGKYPTDNIVSWVVWSGGHTQTGGNYGFYYVNGILSANLNFTGSGGTVTYNGPIYQ